MCVCGCVCAKIYGLGWFDSIGGLDTYARASTRPDTSILHSRVPGGGVGSFGCLGGLDTCARARPTDTHTHDTSTLQSQSNHHPRPTTLDPALGAGRAAKSIPLRHRHRALDDVVEDRVVQCVSRPGVTLQRRHLDTISRSLEKHARIAEFSTHKDPYTFDPLDRSCQRSQSGDATPIDIGLGLGLEWARRCRCFDRDTTVSDRIIGHPHTIIIAYPAPRLPRPHTWTGGGRAAPRPTMEALLPDDVWREPQPVLSIQGSVDWDPGVHDRCVGR